MITSSHFFWTEWRLFQKHDTVKKKQINRKYNLKNLISREGHFAHLICYDSFIINI